MGENTNIVRWQPYTVIVTWEDEVYIYHKSWLEYMDFVMEHGFVVIKDEQTTIHRKHIKKTFEVNNKKNTSVENWIYTQPRQYVLQLLKEHKDRRGLNGVGIKTIEQGQEILDRLMGKPQKTAETKETKHTPIDKKKALATLAKAKKNLRKPPEN